MSNPEHEKTNPSLQESVNPKVYPLLIDEEMARKELLERIDELLDCKVAKNQFVSVTEQTLKAVKDYMTGVKELTDLLKN